MIKFLLMLTLTVPMFTELPECGDKKQLGCVALGEINTKAWKSKDAIDSWEERCFSSSEHVCLICITEGQKLCWDTIVPIGD
jgi:hypothetical protein